MPEQEFERWYGMIKDAVSKYDFAGARMAVIAGFFDGMNPETTLTAAQVAEILKLRNKK